MQSEFTLHISCSSNRKIRQLSFDQNINIGDDISSNTIPENEGCYIIANKTFLFIFFLFLLLQLDNIENKKSRSGRKAKEKYSKSSAVDKVTG